jgi:YbgC/YbaW family acyl-CoA thioester hydrolase
MEFEYYFTVRGYELDSYGHVNNAVYLNYIEQATWEILRGTDTLSYFMDNGIVPIIIEINIRYIHETKIFDEMVIKSKIGVESPYMVFMHNMYNAKTRRKSCKATVKYLYLTRERSLRDLPEYILAKWGVHK